MYNIKSSLKSHRLGILAQNIDFWSKSPTDPVSWKGLELTNMILDLTLDIIIVVSLTIATISSYARKSSEKVFILLICGVAWGATCEHMTAEYFQHKQKQVTKTQQKITK